VTDAEWARVVDGLEVGDHAMLLYRDMAGMAPVAERFIAAGLRANEYVVALLPMEEMAAWRPIFDRAIHSTEGARDAGTLQIVPLLPSRLNGDAGPLDLVPLVRRILREAKADNRSEVRVVGRFAPALLERGHERNAVAIERFAAEQHFRLRVLCLYDASRMDNASAETVQSIVGSHSHSIAHLGQDEYLVEAF